jgi:hypothetical protein
MVESQPSKLVVWVRFPSPAPYIKPKILDFGLISYYALVAQLDRVVDFESNGRRFDSCQAHHTKSLVNTKFARLLLFMGISLKILIGYYED